MPLVNRQEIRLRINLLQLKYLNLFPKIRPMWSDWNADFGRHLRFLLATSDTGSKESGTVSVMVAFKFWG